MRLIGRNLDSRLGYSMLRKRPYASCIQSIQRVRQATGLDYRIACGGKSLHPLIITYEVTHRCNLRCKTCWLWGTHGRYPGDEELNEMSLTEVTRFIDSIASFRPYLLLTGGEPLLYADIAEVVRHASARGLFVGLITNGMLAAAGKLEKAVRAGLDFATVSIDSPEREIHNLIRGNPASFDNCLRTLGVIRELRGRKRSPVLTINVTVSDYNHKNLLGMLALAEDAGADVLQFQHQWFSEHDTSVAYNRWAGQYLGLDSHHMETFETCSTLRVDGALVHEQLSEIKEKAGIQIRVVPDLSLGDTITYYRGMSPVGSNRCTTPWCGAIVKPDGDVVPCVDYVVGNVRETPFKQIWNSQRMRLFRTTVREQGYFPGCTRCCGFFG